MTELTSVAWFAAVSNVFGEVEGLKRVYGVKGGSPGPKVVPMAEDLVEGPIGILGYGGGSVTPGSWERQTHTLNAAIWVPSPASALGRAYEQAIGYVDAVMDVFPPRAKAGAIHPELASVLVTEFEAIDGRTWGAERSERSYVVLPFSIQVVRNRAAQYIPA